jgi:putative FmdB family regulatory protein
VGRRKTKLTILDCKRKEKEVMAIYEYNCATCSENFIKQRSITTEDPGYKCETCNTDLTRVYSNVGAVFNGSGFYSTDNRRV